MKEFRAISDSEWVQKLKEDLKGESWSKLLWEDENSLEYKAYYRISDLQKISDLKQIQTANQIEGGWSIVQQLVLDKDNLKSAAESIASALNNGAAAVRLSSNLSLNEIEEFFKRTKLDRSLCKVEIPWKNYREGTDSDMQYLLDPISDAMVEGKELEKKELGEFTNAFREDLPIKVLVNSSIYKNFGSNQVQEIAYSLQHAVEYFDLFTENGFTAEYLAKKMEFKFAMSSSLFAEIAKIRAFRYLWGKVTAAYHIDLNIPAEIHAEASAYYLADAEVYNNLLRESIQMMAAACTSCNSISAPSFDLGKDSTNEFGQRMARNIQIILKEEAYLDKVSDPSAGSYYIEELSAKFAEAAWEMFLKLEKKSGLLQAYKSGEIRESIEKVHQHRLQNMLLGKDKKIGVNAYVQANNSNDSLKSDIPGNKAMKPGALEARNLSKEYFKMSKG